MTPRKPMIRLLSPDFSAMLLAEFRGAAGDERALFITMIHCLETE
ncbi:hypothetical protein [Burkholderia gladioli]|nr:hypothetical protein [Burkholderia gladioli]